MRKILIIPSALISVTILSFLLLISNTSFAEDSTVSNISITVPVSCNITDTINTPHTATINPGQIKEDIGTTTFKVFCNDNAGYSIYAIGYSNEEYGNTNLIPINTTNPNITTGTTTSGNTSSWSMKLSPVAGTYAPTIENNFNTYRTVPDTYTKAATLTSNTDFTIGSTLQSTYKAYIQSNQPADTYIGKVKYTLVHPNDAGPPVDPRFVASLDTGENMNAKMKGLANNVTNAEYYMDDFKIAAIKRSDSLPIGFIPSEANTITTSTSPQPVYIFFDDATSTMYYYTEAISIMMNPNSSFAFAWLLSLANIDAISDWDTSAVTNMSYMFIGAPITSINALANWDVSSTIDMPGIFAGTNLVSADGVNNWNTSSATNMSEMFLNVFALIDIDALSYWDTSSVTNMSSMFSNTFSLANIDGASNWNTSSVTHMSEMFIFTYSLTNVNGARNWDTGSVTDINYMFNGANNIDATVLNNWNVSRVTSKTDAFTNPVDKQPCWYRGIPCTSSNNNNSVSPTNTNSPTPTNNVVNNLPLNSNTPSSANITNNHTTPGNLSQTSPQGETYRSDRKINPWQHYLPFLISLFTISLANSIFFFILAKRKKDEEEQDLP